MGHSRPLIPYSSPERADYYRRRKAFENRPWLRLKILERDGYICQICGADCSDRPNVDHIVALIDGGTNDEANLRAACWPCNRKNTPKGRSGA